MLSLTTLMLCRFFLVTAANVMVLGTVWKRKQSPNVDFPTGVEDLEQELTAIDAATRLLDFCGQRSAFARKYSILVKNLCLKLSKASPRTVSDGASLHSARIASQTSTPYSCAGEQSPELSANSTAKSSLYLNQSDSVPKSSHLLSPMTAFDIDHGYFPPFGYSNAQSESWAEDYGLANPNDDILPYGTVDSHLLRYYKLTCERPYAIASRLQRVSLF